jgi:hypothetical protein
MKKSLLALACAVAALAPFAVAHAQDVTLSGTTQPTILSPGEVGTAAVNTQTGLSTISASGTNSYFFEFTGNVTQATSFLGNLNISGPVTISSEIVGVSGTTLTESAVDDLGGTTFNVTPGFVYLLRVTGPAGAGFVANVSSVVSAAPEPSTWALMMLGVGAIGLMMRRNRLRGVSALTAA